MARPSRAAAAAVLHKPLLSIEGRALYRGNKLVEAVFATEGARSCAWMLHRSSGHSCPSCQQSGWWQGKGR